VIKRDLKIFFRGALFNTVIFVLFLRFSELFSSQQSFPVVKTYLDPSTGAMIISAIVGIFATIALGVKTFWYKISSLFKRKQEKIMPPAQTKPVNSSGPDK
jgi:multisubunit Na+/H+ antiporter MnhC subunit